VATTVPASALRTALARVIRAAPRLPYNPRTHGLYRLGDEVPVGRHLSVYDPTVFGSYDLETQRVVARDENDPGVWALGFDGLMAETHALHAETGPLIVEERYDLVLSLLAPGQGLLLDACTPAPEQRVREAVEQLGYRYQAIDIEGGDQVQREDLTALSFGDATVAAVISLDTLEHIPDYGAALREIYRVLVRHGVAIVHTPCYYVEREHSAPLDPERDPWGHVRYFSARELVQTIAETGFRVLRVGFQLDYGAALCVLAKP
jgi:SAM-dependent methyltransferase